jgi:hypothetical protein
VQIAGLNTAYMRLLLAYEPLKAGRRQCNTAGQFVDKSAEQ